MFGVHDQAVDHARKLFPTAIILVEAFNPFQDASEVTQEDDLGTSRSFGLISPYFLCIVLFLIMLLKLGALIVTIINISRNILTSLIYMLLNVKSCTWLTCYPCSAKVGCLGCIIGVHQGSHEFSPCLVRSVSCLYEEKKSPLLR